ncbi:MAG TPA: selenocysteine-specific translation elongation factor [Stellaceae bacterium]|nr:selenocysteine-specific translation elongation factor [Stellaceae bacterium]
MIIATAGHVDHGKTLLVKALTGIDADRLPEEKKRGMTIDLGFAYWPVAPGVTIGFVDVPGHERFIHNMLCGVTGIDFVLLIVAADDGVMPQTREHVAIIDLLGVRSGTIAITKTDRVAPERVATVARETAALLAGTGLADAPVFPVSAVTGAGIAALQAHLAAAARAAPARQPHGRFRLAIDRAFSVVGAGLVVTGTVFAGSVAVGETVRVLQAGRTARVRSIHVQNAEARRGSAGDRCALNLAGPDLSLGHVARGDWVVTPDAPDPVAKLDARIRVLAAEPRALAHWTPVHVHLGAADVTGRVAVLEAGGIAPGGNGLAQLVLDRPLGAVRGDRLILRDQSARRTVGGGSVIDIDPPRRGRAKPERLAQLRTMELSDDAAALAALLEGAAAGLDLGRFAAGRNLTPAEAEAVFAAQPMRVVATGETRRGFAAARWEELKAEALAALAAWHRRAPNAGGPSEDRLLPGTKLPREAVLALAAELVRDGRIVRDGTGVRLPAHQPKLAAADAALWRRVEPLIDRSPLRPPALHELAQGLNAEPKALEALLVRVARLGLLVRLAPNRFFRPAALRALGELAAAVAAQSPDSRVSAAAFRDRAGIGRNVAIEVLEYFDRVKFTRRVGDAHEILRPAAEAFGAGEG